MARRDASESGAAGANQDARSDCHCAPGFQPLLDDQLPPWMQREGDWGEGDTRSRPNVQSPDPEGLDRMEPRKPADGDGVSKGNLRGKRGLLGVISWDQHCELCRGSLPCRPDKQPP